MIVLTRQIHSFFFKMQVTIKAKSGQNEIKNEVKDGRENKANDSTTFGLV